MRTVKAPCLVMAWVAVWACSAQAGYPLAAGWLRHRRARRGATADLKAQTQ